MYYGGIPNIVNEALGKIKSSKDVYIFSVATYGGCPANPLKIVDKKLKDKGLKLNSGFLISMPGNYIPMYDAYSEKTQIRRFKNANNKIEIIKDVINARKTMKYEKSPFIVDRPLGAISEKKVKKLSKYDKKFTVDNKCSKCGICSRICPVNNISFKNGKLQWLGKCEQCMACIQYCPKEAIQCGKKTVKRKRYRNPNVDYFKVLNAIKTKNNI